MNRLTAGFVICLLLVLSACETVPVIEADVASSVDAAQADRRPLIRDHASGTVHIQQVNDRRVVVSASSEEGIVSHFFTLDALESLPSLEPMRIEDADLFYAAGVLGIYPRDGEAPLILTVRDVEDIHSIIMHGDDVADFDRTERVRLMRFPRQWPEVVLTGFSLAQRALSTSDTFSLDDVMRPGVFADVSSDTLGLSSCDPRIAPLSSELEPSRCSNCPAGGPGSTGCSYDTPLVNCAVTCVPPFFSCCSALGCRCCSG